MFRRDWLSRLWNACHPPTRRARGSERCGVAGEVLELRQYLSASVGLARDGHTLIIRGDDADNHITITQDGRRGVAVVADGVASSFWGIDQIIVETGAGHDVVDVESVEGLPLIRSLNIDTGAGHDRVSVTVGDPTGLADPPDPDMPTDQMPVIRIDTGAGNDVVDVETVEGLPLIRSLNINTGAGNDRVSVAVGNRNVLADPPDPDMPTDQMPVIRIDTGAGNDVIDVRLRRNQVLLDIDDGPGNDLVRVVVGGPTSINGGT